MKKSTEETSKHIQTQTTPPTKEFNFGSQTTEMVDWLGKNLAPFYDHLARLSLDKLNGKGWEEITYDEQIGWMKFPYDDSHPLDETEFVEKSAHLIFTGKFLCGHFAYIVGKAIKYKFPDIDLKLIKLGVQMSEQKDSENHPALDHRLLELKFENELAVLADFSYGQIRHSTSVVIVPVDEINQYFPNPYRKSNDEIERIDFIEAEGRMEREFQEGASRLSEQDLNDLVQIFNT